MFHRDAHGFLKQLLAVADANDGRIDAAQNGVNAAQSLYFFLALAQRQLCSSALRDFLSVIGTDRSLAVNMADHITLSGVVTENGNRRPFSRAQELEHISSTGLSSVIIITLMSGLLNAVRGSEPVFVPWIADEVGKYDSSTFAALLKLLQDNRIDVIFASPHLALPQLALFAQRYVFLDHGEVRHYKPRMRLVEDVAASA